MKYIPKKILFFGVTALLIILLAKPDIDNPFTYGHLSVNFRALLILFGFIIAITVDVYARLVKLEKQQESAVTQDEKAKTDSFSD